MTMTAKGRRLEAEALRKQADRLHEQADRLEAEADAQDGIVQVTFGSSGLARRYAYLLPEGADAKIDDEFVAPASSSYNYREQIVMVVGFGRGEYDGPLKRLTGKVVREFPVDEPGFDTFDTEDIGYGRCPDCGTAYGSDFSSPCGGMLS